MHIMFLGSHGITNSSGINRWRVYQNGLLLSLFSCRDIAKYTPYTIFVPVLCDSGFKLQDMNEIV